MTEVLCVAYTYTSTFATQSARTTPPYLSFEGDTALLCATLLLSNPYGLALIRLCEHTHFTITALCAYDPTSSPPKELNGLCVRFSFTIWWGVHSFAVRNYVAVNPPRAGAHSFVRSHSFHYYGTCVPTPPPHLHQQLRKSSTAGVRFFLFLVDEGDTAFLCATLLLSNPYGLALIRLCKHTHFTITAPCAYDPPPHLHQKN